MTVKSPVLVLNASYEPIAICQARRVLGVDVYAACRQWSYDAQPDENTR